VAEDWTGKLTIFRVPENAGNVTTWTSQDELPHDVSYRKFFEQLKAPAFLYVPECVWK
jgi:hypothetical protein